MELFKATHVDVGVIRVGQANVPVKWFFEGLTREKFALDAKGEPLVHAGCGCTASFRLEDDGIVALYSDRGGTIGPITKAITVHYKPSPGTPIYVKNDRGVDVINTALGKTVLTFTVNATQ